MLRSVQGELDGGIAALGVIRVAVPGDTADAWSDLDAVAAVLAGDPAVESAEPDGTVRLTHTPNDQYYASDPYVRLGQWGVRKAQVDRAWDAARASPTITVAVIDTGVDRGHPDLQGGALLPGRTFITVPSAACRISDVDDNGHGTNVTGILAANADNGIGIAGVAFGVKVLPLKALDCDGVGLLSDVAAALVYAVDQGAKIVSVSLGSDANSPVLQNAVRYAAARNVLVFAAGGNCGIESTRCSALNEISYPAAYPEAIAVAATDVDDTRAPFSTVGSFLTLAAPGRYMVSTVPTYPTKSGVLNYAAFSGTSQATPFAAGVAALVWSREPGLTAAQVRSRLIATVDDLGVPGVDTSFGAGRVNALRAVTTSATSSYGARYDLSALPKTVARGSRTAALVRVTNTGTAVWRAAGAGRVYLSLSIASGPGTIVAGAQGALPTDVAPGTTVPVVIEIAAPSTAGTYTLSFDLVQDGAGSFAAFGVQRATATLEVGEAAFGATYTTKTSATALALGATTTVDVTLANSGGRTWLAAGPNPVRLSYHWLDARGATLVWDGPRTPLPRDVAPGEQVTVSLGVAPPAALGTYVLRIDLVQEGVSWFSGLGIAPRDVAVNVNNGWAAAYTLPPSLPILLPGGRALVSVTVRNDGSLVWRAGGAQPMRLAAHLSDRTGATVLWDGERAALAADVAPGQSATVLVPIAAPRAPGSYRARVDVVQEGVTWASANGVATGDASLLVVPDHRATFPTGPITVSRTSPSATVQIANSSAATWTPTGTAPVRVSSHWLDAAGRALVWDGPRADLPRAVAPGESVTVVVPLAPPPLGAALLVIDLVSEGLEWFGAGPQRQVTLIQ
ncbi:MAG TPA: S8 family serine peptidase [Candidatus Limnocylindria bacterium]|nr:S8 family serine peptidase [Candidatus Limnocylindria bacterium]